MIIPQRNNALNAPGTIIPGVITPLACIAVRGRMSPGPVAGAQTGTDRQAHTARRMHTRRENLPFNISTIHVSSFGRNPQISASLHARHENLPFFYPQYDPCLIVWTQPAVLSPFGEWGKKVGRSVDWFFDTSDVAGAKAWRLQMPPGEADAQKWRSGDMLEELLQDQIDSQRWASSETAYWSFHVHLPCGNKGPSRKTSVPHFLHHFYLTCCLTGCSSGSAHARTRSRGHGLSVIVPCP